MGLESLTSGIWYHVAGVRNGTTMTLYLNGKSVATSTISSNSISVNSGSLDIGYFPSYGQYFDGTHTHPHKKFRKKK